MTHRGRSTLLLGLALYAAAWLVGSQPLYPVAIGLGGAALAAGAWVRLAARPSSVERRTARAEHVEGDDVRVHVTAELTAGLRPLGLTLTERLGRLGEQRAELHVEGRRASGRYALYGVPRGRYRFDSATIALEDPFGLARAEDPLPAGGALLVYPRLVELDGLFSESGRQGHHGRRLLLRRPAGFEVHGVRDYQEGESLRRVHWPSTAKRGRLMVKDLEDAPRDELAVLLDAQAGGVTGGRSDSSFDAQVRAAGSILLSLARSGRRSLLVVNAATPVVQRVASLDGDWQAAYDTLAASEPNGAAPLAALLAGDAGPVGRAVEIVAVTAALPPALVERLCQRAAGGRRTSLVYVDAPSFAGVTADGVRTTLLRLAASGVTVTRLRRGDDLARTLERPHDAAVAHA